MKKEEVRNVRWFVAEYIAFMFHITTSSRVNNFVDWSKKQNNNLKIATYNNKLEIKYWIVDYNVNDKLLSCFMFWRGNPHSNRVGKVPSQTETHTTHYTTCRDMLKRHIDTITVYRIFKNIVWVCVIFFRIVIAFHHDVFV